MSEFEEFDPTQGEQFREFDVSAEAETKAEVTIESLGGLSDSEDQVRSLLAARDELERRLMAPAGARSVAGLSDDEPYTRNNVVGVGIGEKVINGAPTGQLAVKVLVKEKRHESRVSSEALVPQTLGGVAIDVEQTGEIYASMFTARRRPAPCGVSIGNCNTTAFGTLGCLVTRNTDLFILSCNHVLALVNTSPLNAGIAQPGLADGGVCPQDIMARLTQFVPINFAAGTTNLVDAAIAQTSPALVDRRILRPNGVLEPITPGVVAPALFLPVQKSGRTSQFRRGAIDLLNLTIDVNHAPLGGVARFVNQFRVVGFIIPFAQPGDSGSLVTTAVQNHPVGMVMSGDLGGLHSYCNPIDAVLSAFGVIIVN